LNPFPVHGQELHRDDAERAAAAASSQAPDASSRDTAAAPTVTGVPPTGPWRLKRYLPAWFSLRGEFRARYQALTNNFRPGAVETDQAMALRTLVEAGFHVGPASFVGEFQDSRAYLTDVNGNVSTIVVNAITLLQAYLNLRFDDAIAKGSTLDLRLGWQTMELGGRRLIGRNRFRNTIQNYTGLTAHWRGSDESELFAFFVLPVRILPPNLDRQALVDNEIEFDQVDIDLRFWGAHYKRANLPLETTGEVYLFVLEEPDVLSGQTLALGRHLYTPGLRLLRAPKRGDWDFDVETVLQFGNRRASLEPTDRGELNVFAQFVHASFGYTFDVAWTPRLSAELDYASGDESPDDGRWGRFDSLFGPRRADLGPTDIYGILGRDNMISQGVRLGVKPSARVDVFVSYRANFLDSRTDFFARSFVRDSSGESGRFGGHQLEIRTRLWLLQEVILWELGGAVFFNGAFLRTAPSANGFGDPLYVYSDLSFLF